MYKILTPAGTLVVDTYREAIEYKKLYGFPFEEIADEFEPSEIFDETDEKMVYPTICIGKQEWLTPDNDEPKYHNAEPV